MNKPIVSVTDLLTSKDSVDNMSCYRSDGTHCKIYGPARVTRITWPDGGIEQIVSDLPLRTK